MIDSTPARIPAIASLETVPPWVLVLVCFPAVLVAYFTLVVGGGQAIGYQYRSEHEDVVYLPLIAAVSAAFFVADVHPVPATVELGYLAFIPLGVAMYAVDTYLWSLWAGKPISRGGKNGRWLLPSVVSSVGEEYLYRGVLSVLIGTLGSIPYLLGSAVFFGINHFVGGRKEVVLKTVNGAVYAGAFLATGSVIPPILAHAAYNVAYIGFVTGRVPFPTAHG